MGKFTVQNPKHTIIYLVMVVAIVLKSQAQFTPQTNKPVNIQQSFQETNPTITSQANTGNTDNEQVSITDPNPNPSSSQYKRIPTAQQYNSLFAQEINKISLSEVVNATVISNGKQICADTQPCKFYYYVIKPKFDPQEKMGFDFTGSGSVRNVFIVSGMHGNEYLGPTAILNAIKYLQTPGTRVILFPMANPSGYDHNTRYTHPTNIDPNRDFPIEQYKKCYQTSSSPIIDHIYRKYHIDLTLALHNGRSQIGWAWGTMRQRINSHTKDELIYRDIGEWLKFLGGKNKKIQMESFTIGTINEVIYPVEGGFEDWAYAVSWYTASVPSTPNRNCNFLKFPFNMTNGLVFLFELGPFHVAQELFGSQEGLRIYPTSTDGSNGYISRAIRMLNGLVKIPNPRLDVKLTKELVVFRLNGCKQGSIENMSIIRKSDGVKHYERTEKMDVEGNLNNKTVQPSVIRLQQQIDHLYAKDTNQMQTVIVQYSLTCDPLWTGNGNTIFGKKRSFNVKQSMILTATPTIHLPQTFYPSAKAALETYQFIGQMQTQSIPDKFQDFMEQNTQFMVVMAILVIVLAVILFVVFVICREITKDRKERKMKKLMKKLEKCGSEGSEGDRDGTMSEDEVGEMTQKQIVVNNKNSKRDKGKQRKQGKRGTQGKQGKQRKEGSKSSKAESYPYMCESDKIMRTEELGESVELFDFDNRNKHMV